jgi:hypothetical protein
MTRSLKITAPVGTLELPDRELRLQAAEVWVQPCRGSGAYAVSVAAWLEEPGAPPAVGEHTRLHLWTVDADAEHLDHARRSEVALRVHCAELCGPHLFLGGLSYPLDDTADHMVLGAWESPVTGRRARLLTQCLRPDDDDESGSAPTTTAEENRPCPT